MTPVRLIDPVTCWDDTPRAADVLTLDEIRADQDERNAEMVGCPQCEGDGWCHGRFGPTRCPLCHGPGWITRATLAEWEEEMRR